MPRDDLVLNPDVVDKVEAAHWSRHHPLGKRCLPQRRAGGSRLELQLHGVSFHCRSRYRYAAAGAGWVPADRKKR